VLHQVVVECRGAALLRADDDQVRKRFAGSAPGARGGRPLGADGGVEACRALLARSAVGHQGVGLGRWLTDGMGSMSGAVAGAERKVNDRQSTPGAAPSRLDPAPTGSKLDPRGEGLEAGAEAWH
jgi:hypothetical protein